MQYKAVLLFIISICVSFQIQSKLLISPTRVLFEENERTEEVILINTSTEELTYRLEWIDNFALPEGGYQLASDAGKNFENSAAEMIRFSPRQVRLKPGERQVIKLLARRGTRFNQAEYRSHLNFIVIPPEANDGGSNTEGMTVQLNLFMNYSIPVMVRTTTNDASIEITDASLRSHPQTGKPVVDFNVTRNGDVSFFANFEVYQKGAGPNPVGRLNAVNIFSELNKITRNITLHDYDSNASGELVIKAIGVGEYASENVKEFVLRQ